MKSAGLGMLENGQKAISDQELCDLCALNRPVNGEMTCCIYGACNESVGFQVLSEGQTDKYLAQETGLNWRQR